MQRDGWTVRKYILLTWLFLLCVSLTACAGSGGGNSNIGLLNEREFKVGSEIGYPPFEMYDDNNQPIGLDIELAAELAQKFNVDVVYEDTVWDGIFAGLETNKYDAVISSVTINAERMETMDFSIPYIKNWQSIAVRKGGPAVTSLEGMHGLTVGFQGATTSDELLADLIADGVILCEISSYDKVLSAFDDLRLGRVDCVLSDSTVAEWYVGHEPDQFEITWHQKNEPGAVPELIGVAVKKGNKLLQGAINEALAELEADGSLNRIRAKWLQ
jgi:polar amino acid transport system substrate-binding protein